ncbi:MAG: hypothetical protein EZS28_020304 [Streblomastix strix]|uniref:Uncharacterized protein n=1 Tax=Streblomastix strix TaxID=222440 RepID=A0A5J4VPD1_9EUKA|nr:MAG: hypothetical protein EZS28_020304 [Streblomastix strix]
MTTDVAPKEWGSKLEGELEMIAVAHRTWNKRQTKLSNLIRKIKVITLSLRSLSQILNNSLVLSLGITSDSETAVFDIKNWRAPISLIMEINQSHYTKEILGIKIRISYPPSAPVVKTEIADALSRLSRARNYKLKEKIFQQACHQMNLNPTIDLFSQYFNNRLPRFISTI